MDEQSTDTSIADGDVDTATNTEVESITDNTIMDSTEETTTILEDIMDNDIDDVETTGCYYNGTVYFDAEDLSRENVSYPAIGRTARHCHPRMEPAVLIHGNVWRTSLQPRPQ